VDVGPKELIMSKSMFIEIWAKDPEKREWTHLALANGQTITLGGTFVETEEGYRQVSHHYTRRRNVIHLEIIEDGRGCDGRLTRYWRGQWAEGGPLERSRGFVWVPKFTETHASQRDYYAEKAGY
jgi:hypothetical protein